MIEPSTVKSVIEGTDIVRLVGEYVQLKKRGRTLTGLCPFHREKTPSFTVSVERNAFYCFGCSTGGSCVDFVMKIEGLSFPEAIGRLADRLGIQIERVAREGGPISRAPSKTLYTVMKSAQSFFVQQLSGAHASQCQSYIAGRGIDAAMIKTFGIGYAPDSWDDLVDYLRLTDGDLADSAKLGLIAERDSGGYYARFRDRLMFPVYNVRGDIVAFGGRALGGGDTAKYINSPESEIYTKGEHLYGLHQARLHISREHAVILVEGNIDVVIMHQFGFCHTVSSMGTALTQAQAKLLYQQSKKLYVMYDGDSAGQKAMLRALAVLLKFDFHALYAVELPKGDDPDSFLRSYGASGLEALIENAQPMGLWCVQKICSEILEMPIELRKSGNSDLRELLEGFSNVLTRRHYLQEAARLLGVDSHILSIELGLESREGAKALPSKTSSQALPQSVEFELAKLILTSTERFEDFVSQQGLDLIEDAALRAMLSKYAMIEDKASSYAIMTHLAQDERELYEKLVCSESPVEDGLVGKWYEAGVAYLVERWSWRERKRLGHDMAEAIAQKDSASIERLSKRMSELISLTQELQKDRKYVWHQD